MLLFNVLSLITFSLFGVQKHKILFPYYIHIVGPQFSIFNLSLIKYRYLYDLFNK